MTWLLLGIGATGGILAWEAVWAAVRIVRTMLSGFQVEGEE